MIRGNHIKSLVWVLSGITMIFSLENNPQESTSLESLIKEKTPKKEAVLKDSLEKAPPQKTFQPTHNKLQILEDKLHSLEVYKIRDLENRIQDLEAPKQPDTSGAQRNLTPLAEEKISKWGTKRGIGLSFGSVSGNTALGFEAHIIKLPFLPRLERPMTHQSLFGIALGLDWWINTGYTDNEEWGLSPYFKITGNSLVFENYLRIYASIEPVLVYGHAMQGQTQKDLHLGLRTAFGAEFYASKNYTFFAEAGIMKTESIDGSSKDTGFTPIIKAGPRFWF